MVGRCNFLVRIRPDRISLNVICILLLSLHLTDDSRQRGDSPTLTAGPFGAYRIYAVVGGCFKSVLDLIYWECRNLFGLFVV